MKRIQYACLSQTIHFQLKEELGHSLAVSHVKGEYENYKRRLEDSHIKYKIVEEKTQEDGSIMIRVKKQVNNYEVGSYLD